MTITRLLKFSCAGVLLLASSCFEDEMIYSFQEGIPTENEADNSAVEEIIEAAAITVPEILASKVPTHAETNDTDFDAETATTITLNETSITVSGEGAAVENTTVTIVNAGNYIVQGNLLDGQIVVNTTDEAPVKIYLEGISISNSQTSPFLVMSANKVILLLENDTTSEFNDTPNYVFEEDNTTPNATLFSNADITIAGEGTLNINAEYQEALHAENGLIISEEVTIQATAATDAVVANTYLVVDNASLNITASEDALKTTNEEDLTLGYLYLNNATIDINVERDAIQAASDALIVNSTITVISGGGNTVVLEEGAPSAKAIKANHDIVVDSGTVTIDAADDAFNASRNLIINGGSFSIVTGDDALHADATVAIFNGNIQVLNSYEGLEASTVIIAGGTSFINSEDDGINAAGDDDTIENAIYISNGYTVVNADGDGLDANGSIHMINGILIVNGPENNGNAAIDYDTSFTMNGGTLIATGSSGMAQTASETSVLNAVLINFVNTYPENTLINISNSEGETILSFAPQKTFQSIAFAADGLITGATYTVSVGGIDTGINTDGWYEGGTYSEGDFYTYFTIENTVTVVE